MMRDPVIDATRAIAIVGVVLGHWLVTAVVLTGDGLVVDSPLRWMPELAPVSWVFQTLGLFFFVGGFGAARSAVPWWLRARKLVLPVVVLVGVWAAVLFGLSLRGLPQQTVSTVGYLVVTPLWFLAVYVVLLAFTPLVSRLGWWGVGFAVGLVVLDVGWVNVVAVWWAPWQIGVLVAQRGQRRSWGVALFVVGAGAFALLLGAGYPVSAVGVPGAAESNLSPPSALALALALAQVGLVLVLRPSFRAPAVNARALPIFLVHQSALLVVTLVGSVFGSLRGLHTPPSEALWVLERGTWLPVFGCVCLVLLRYRREQGGHDRRAVQRDHRGGRLQDQQWRDAGQRGEQPRAAVVAGAGARGVQEVPGEQQVDQVLQRVDLEHDQRAARARETGDDEPEDAQHAVARAERDGESGAVGLTGAAGAQGGVALEAVEHQEHRKEEQHQDGQPAWPGGDPVVRDGRAFEQAEQADHGGQHGQVAEVDGHRGGPGELDHAPLAVAFEPGRDARPEQHDQADLRQAEHQQADGGGLRFELPSPGSDIIVRG